MADIKTPLIGADFLKHYDLLIDVKRGKLIDNQTKLETNGKIPHTETLAKVTTFNVNHPCASILEEFKDITIFTSHHYERSTSIRKTKKIVQRNAGSCQKGVSIPHGNGNLQPFEE